MALTNFLSSNIIFWAGMLSTQKSEGVNAYFEWHVNLISSNIKLHYEIRLNKSYLLISNPKTQLQIAFGIFNGIDNFKGPTLLACLNGSV